MKFKNNFERDIWYDWYQQILRGEYRYENPPASGITPAYAAEKADEIVKQLQSRRELED